MLFIQVRIPRVASHGGKWYNKVSGGFLKVGFSKKIANFIKKKVFAAQTAAFFGALLIGVICHMNVLTSNLPVYDTFWNIYSGQDMISSGRPFLTYACGITSYYNLPWLNGIVAILYIALAAMIIVRIFDIQKPVSGAILGGLLATFPAVIGTFAFSYTSDGYMLAFLLAALAVFLTKEYKWGFIPGIFALGFSVGIYQSYFFVGAMLALFVCIIELSEGQELKKFLSRLWRFAAMTVGGYVFYVIALKVMLFVKHESLSGYQGTDKVAGISLSGILPGLKAAVLDFKEFTLHGGVFTENIWMKMAFIAFILLSVFAFVFVIVKNRTYKKIVNLILILACMAFIPFVASGVKIMSQDALFHILMRMPWAVLFAAGIALSDRVLSSEAASKKTGAENEKERITWSGIGGFLGIIMAGAMIFHFILSANIVYFNLSERYEKTYALCLRIADRLEQTEGYETGDPVAVLGGFPNVFNYPTTEVTEKVTRGYHETGGDYAIESAEKYAEFMKHYLNVTIRVPDFEKQLEIGATEEYLQMPCFPEEGCIKRIDGIWVIKING